MIAAMPRGRRLGRAATAVLVGLWGLGLGVAPAVAADAVSFGAPRASRPPLLWSTHTHVITAFRTTPHL